MSHYFEPLPAAESSDLSPLSVELAGRLVRVATAPGVFSHRRLDLGTQVLLRTEARLGGAGTASYNGPSLPAGPPVSRAAWASADSREDEPATAAATPGIPRDDAGRPSPSPTAAPDHADRPSPGPAAATYGAGANLLDLGCGWGPIALTLGLANPEATVWAVDANPRALDLTRRNAASLGLRNVRAAPPEDVDGALRFELIWSNPPIRIGKAALRSLLRDWLGRLAETGHADLVVQKNLGADSLARWLSAEAGFPTVKLASAKGYRVLRSIAS